MQDNVFSSSGYDGEYGFQAACAETAGVSAAAGRFARICEEKLIAYCTKHGITADSPQDFKNIAMALTAEGMANGMTRIGKLALDEHSVYILSYEPQAKIASVVANDAVHIPCADSLSKIRQLEQQHGNPNQTKCGKLQA